MSLLPCVEIEPTRPADAALTWLHQFGASGCNFAPAVPEHLGHGTPYALRAIGFAPVYRPYPVAHNVSLDEIVELGGCLRRWLHLNRSQHVAGAYPQSVRPGSLAAMPWGNG